VPKDAAMAYVLVEEETVAKSVVEVALVVVPFTTLRPKIEEEAVLTMIPTVVVGVSAPLRSAQSWKLVVCATVA
jgi:hypothetical protein